VSQKGRLRRLDAGVRWLETEGTYLRIAGLVKSLEMLRDIADRADVDPAFAAEWKETFPSIVLPPSRRKAAASRPKPEPAPEPAPSVASQTPPREVEPPRSQLSPPAIESHPAPVVPVKDVPVMEKPPPRPPDPPAPMPGMPVEPRQPDMEIRPVHWRQRGPHDYYEDEDDSYGRCITEYDVLRDEYDDDA